MLATQSLGGATGRATHRRADRTRSAALLLAGGIYLVAWGFGSRSLYPIATGLALAVVGARIWVEILRQPVSLRRHLGAREYVEGDDVTIGLEASAHRNPGPRTLEVYEQISKLGERRVELNRRGPELHVRYVLPHMSRGRYRFDAVRAVFEDPFGLARAEQSLGAESTLLVYPRLVELERVFSELGATLAGGHVVLRRTAGFDLHSVREYQQGESLRKVHWRTTAKRGELMVKELEDMPHDEIAVLLDADSRAVVGESFDVQVARPGRSCARTRFADAVRCSSITSSPPETCQVGSIDSEWRSALELLASAEPTGKDSLARFLQRDASPAMHAVELVVVTAALEPQLVDALLDRAFARRPASLVLIDASSFNRRSPFRCATLRSCGSRRRRPVVTVQRGDDLAAKLSGLQEAYAVSG